jgi:endonuclease YncB( thermonuclease family)
MTRSLHSKFATIIAGIMVALALQLLAPLVPAQSFAQATPPSRTFSETGMSVSGIFLEYWLVSGGLSQQGLPISEPMTEVSDVNGQSYTIQYFERAVFESHPENKGTPFEVLLSQLGTFEYQRKYPTGAPGQQPNNSAGSVLFPETGKRLGGKFLHYWRDHGGLLQQGLPISDEFIEKSDLDGKEYRVQYFERAVFEEHLENPAPNDVLLSQLGTFRYKGKYEGAGAQPVQPAQSPVPSAGWETAQVVRVVDGDTIVVNVGGREATVRYLLVNTPETVAPNTPVECYGREASAANKVLVEGKMVYLSKDISETDRFERLLRYVFTLDGWVNAELVRGGYAQVATFPPDVKYERSLRELERQARDAKRGLWGDLCQKQGAQPTQPAAPPANTPVAAQPTATRVPAAPPPPPAPPTPTTKPAAPSGGKVIISFIYYDGQESRTEGDEYVVVKNTGPGAVNLQGYSINAGDPGQDFTFPSQVLNAGAEVRVYTNRDIPGSFSFDYGRAIWNNDGDCGYLYDPQGTEVSRYCY